MDDGTTDDGIGQGTGGVKPRRRRWKRWTVAVLLMAIGFGVWMVFGESETVRKARALQVGQTVAEVEAIMGEPVMVSFTQTDGLNNEPLDEVLYFATPFEHRRF